MYNKGIKSMRACVDKEYCVGMGQCEMRIPFMPKRGDIYGLEGTDIIQVLVAIN